MHQLVAVKALKFSKTLKLTASSLYQLESHIQLYIHISDMENTTVRETLSLSEKSYI